MTAPASARRRIRWVALGVLAMTALIWLSRTEAWATLTDADRLEQRLDDLGWVAPFATAAVFVAAVPVGVPGLVFVLPAAALFDPVTAVTVTLVGGYGSSAIGMWFARTVGRDTVQRRLPDRFHVWDQRLAQRGVWAVILLRLVTYLAAPADWLLGLTRIPARALAIGTALGLIPPTLFYVYAGAGIFDLLR